jgi:hypothetical protein
MHSMIYKSNLGEIKSLAGWIDFATANSAIFAISSSDTSIKIVTGPTFQEKVLRVLTEWNFFEEKPQLRTEASKRTKTYSRN